MERRGTPRARDDLPGEDIDYNGYGFVAEKFPIQIGDEEFTGLEALQQRTTEKHSIRVGLDIFREAIVLPDPPLRNYCPIDFGLRPGAAAVDAGVVIPGVNDDFRGSAPDLGAYELGGKTPVYGPRPISQKLK